jgi:hypothetical protein
MFSQIEPMATTNSNATGYYGIRLIFPAPAATGVKKQSLNPIFGSYSL